MERTGARGNARASPKSSDRKRAGVLYSSGAVLFLLLTLASEAMYPNFSLQTNAISDLAAVGVRTSPVEEFAILSLGLCWSLGAYALFRNTGRRWLFTLNFLPGIGFLIGGLSPENVNVIIHSIGTFAFPLGAIASICSYQVIESQWKYFSVVLGSLSLVSTFFIFAGYRVVCGSCGYQQGMNATLLGLGGWESMIIFPLLVWMIGLGSCLLSQSSYADSRRGSR